MAPGVGALYIRPLSMNTDLARLKRLKLRASRRGFLEADLILGPFAELYGPSLTPEELDWFERLLDQPDQDVYGWILERTEPPPEFGGEMMRKLRNFRDEAHKYGR